MYVDALPGSLPVAYLRSILPNSWHSQITRRVFSFYRTDSKSKVPVQTAQFALCTFIQDAKAIAGSHCFAMGRNDRNRVKLRLAMQTALPVLLATA